VDITKVNFTTVVEIEGKIKKEYKKDFVNPEEPIRVVGKKKELEKLKEQFADQLNKKRKKVVSKEIEEVRKKFAEGVSKTLKDLRQGKIDESEALKSITKYASDWITTEFPGEFVSVEPIIERKEGLIRLTLEVSPKAIANYVDDTVPTSAPLSNPERLVSNFIEVRQLMNKRATTHPKITAKLDRYRPVAIAKSKLESGEYKPDDLLFTAEEMKTIRQISPTLFSRILPGFTAINRALWAAQLVKNCEEGVTGVCKYIESAVEAGPGVEVPEFSYNVLRPAWELHLEGKFNASKFVEEHIAPAPKAKKKPPKIPWRIENFSEGWEITSPNTIENKDIPAKIEVRRTDGQLEVVTTVKGETYDTEIVSTEGGAEFHAQTIAKEVSTYYSSSPSSSGQETGGEKEETSEERSGEAEERITEEKILEDYSKRKSEGKSTLSEMRKEFKRRMQQY